jgi:hypothetical protein
MGYTWFSGVLQAEDPGVVAFIEEAEGEVGEVKAPESVVDGLEA